MLQRSTTTIFVASVATVGMVGALYFYLSSHVDDNRTPANITSNQENQEKLLLKDRTCPRRSLNVKKDHVVEICLSDLQSVREALSGGCESIELCVNRIEGGTSPITAIISL